MQRIAQVLKSNGTDGELLISFFDIGPEDIDLQEPVFIYFDGLPVPFFIRSFRQRGNDNGRRRAAVQSRIQSLNGSSHALPADIPAHDASVLYQ